MQLRGEGAERRMVVIAVMVILWLNDAIVVSVD